MPASGRHYPPHPGKAMPVRRRERCLPTCWMQERGVVQLPGVDSPSRLYATPGAADVG